MSKNVAVFVDVANIFYAAKAAGVDIDYVTLLKSASAGRDLVRAYAYTGLDPDNENQRNFHDFLRRHGYRVVSKDIRKYGDGKVKANLDIELVVDLMKTARNLDIAIVVSGDGDFAPAIRAVQELGVRVEVISFRGNTSSDLMDVADQFTDITQLAKVERDSTRSGRRVADDEHDLSMTEVPDKLTEGAGASRGRGGRARTGRGRATETPVAARRGASRTGATPAIAPDDGELSGAATGAAAGPAGPSGSHLVALPGERLSRVALPIPAASSAPDPELEDEGALAAFGPEPIVPADDGAADAGESAGDSRRRRRRGGRGRGRGRGAGEGSEPFSPAAPTGDDRAAGSYTPRPSGSTAFGSFWDSQIGTPSRRPDGPPLDDEDLDEPAIPEYLIAERRQRAGGVGRGQHGGGRGGRAGAYAAFVDRERFGRGGGGGINRYPDVSGRERPRDAVPPRDRVRPVPGEGNEPWSEVPPELEALLRAQLANRPRSAAPPQAAVPGRPGAPGVADDSPPARGRGRGRPARSDASPAIASPESGRGSSDATAPAADAGADATPRRTGRGGRGAGAVIPAAQPREPEATEVGSLVSTSRGRSSTGARATSRRQPAEPSGGSAAASDGPLAGQSGEAVVSGTARRHTRSASKPEAPANPGPASTDGPAKPRRRAASGTLQAGAASEEGSAPAATSGARRRTIRKAADAPPL